MMNLYLFLEEFDYLSSFQTNSFSYYLSNLSHSNVEKAIDLF
jgi:hypothetical protein